jgi:hypothetical protein
MPDIQDSANLSEWASLFTMLLFVGAIATVLAERHQKGRTILLILAGFFAALLKIWIYQQAPQWNDISPDSVRYQLHAQALALHWKGESVDAAAYQLRGFLNWHQHLGPYWRTETSIPYAYVFGSHEWIYTAILAWWKSISDQWVYWGVYSNAVWASTFPAASYGLAWRLTSSNRIATFAAIIALVDPLSGVNAAWLLKETFTGFIAVVAAWSVVRLLDSPTILITALASVFIAVLGCTRYVAFVAILGSSTIIAISLLRKEHFRSLGHLSVAIIASTIIFGSLYNFPRTMTGDTWITTLTSPLQSQKKTFTTDSTKNTRTGDSSVIEWRSRWKSDPIGAAATSAARSLFAPYPWTAITHGLSYDNWVELYFPGMILWIIGLPGLIWGVIISLRNTSRESVFLVLYMAAIFAAYTLFFGEWSTRQRVFMLPVFFTFSSIGWCHIFAKKEPGHSSLWRQFKVH